MRTYHRSYKLIQISKYLKRDRVFDLQSGDKAGVLREMAAAMAKSMGGGMDPEALLKAILEREAKISTGVGVGIAIPHARLAEIKDFAVGIGRSKPGIAYDSMDDESVHLVFMIVSPVHQQGLYLNIQAKIALLMSNEEFRNKILQAKDAEEMYRFMKGK